MKNIALILASGSGSRCGTDCPKQFIKINNKTILEYSVEIFEKNQLINEIIVVVSEEYLNSTTKILKKYQKVSKVVCGGETRRESSFNGVMSIKDSDANILIHDAARPFLTDNIVSNCISSLKDYKAICVTIPSTDTIFVVDDDRNIRDIPNRKFLYRAQTPQCFNLSAIKEAHLKAQKDKNCIVTDDCGLILKYTNYKIHTIDGSEDNIKITYQKDIELLKALD